MAFRPIISPETALEHARPAGSTQFHPTLCNQRISSQIRLLSAPKFFPAATYPGNALQRTVVRCCALRSWLILLCGTLSDIRCTHGRYRIGATDWAAPDCMTALAGRKVFLALQAGLTYVSSRFAVAKMQQALCMTAQSLFQSKQCRRCQSPGASSSLWRYTRGMAVAGAFAY